LTVGWVLVVAAVMAGFLAAYLSAALLKPEWFS
jgi:K+-transporting ATPase KdpF subunit